jgi:hypothetical protein
MKSRAGLLQDLNQTVTRLLDTYHALPDPNVEVYEFWSAGDVLAHLTFWHESFARNVDDLVNGRKPTPLKGRLSDLNQEGVERMGHLPLQEVILRFMTAQRVIHDNILNPKLGSIAYRKGSRDYTPEEHLEIVTGHINCHLKDVRKAVKNHHHSTFEHNQ